MDIILVYDKLPLRNEGANRKGKKRTRAFLEEAQFDKDLDVVQVEEEDVKEDTFNSSDDELLLMTTQKMERELARRKRQKTDISMELDSADDEDLMKACETAETSVSKNLRELKSLAVELSVSTERLRNVQNQTDTNFRQPQQVVFNQQHIPGIEFSNQQGFPSPAFNPYMVTKSTNHFMNDQMTPSHLNFNSSGVMYQGQLPGMMMNYSGTQQYIQNSIPVTLQQPHLSMNAGDVYALNSSNQTYGPLSAYYAGMPSLPNHGGIQQYVHSNVPVTVQQPQMPRNLGDFNVPDRRNQIYGQHPDSGMSSLLHYNKTSVTEDIKSLKAEDITGIDDNIPSTQSLMGGFSGKNVPPIREQVYC